MTDTQEVADLKYQVSTLRTTVDTHRTQVRDLYTAINDHIEYNGSNEDGDYISFKELNEILMNVFNSGLIFNKDYEVEVEFYVNATFKIRAETVEAARSQIDDVYMDGDSFYMQDDCEMTQSNIGRVVISSVDIA